MVQWWDVLIFVAGMVLSGLAGWAGSTSVVEAILGWMQAKWPAIKGFWAYLLVQVLGVLVSFVALFAAGQVLPNSFTPENLPALILMILMGAGAGHQYRKRSG